MTRCPRRSPAPFFALLLVVPAVAAAQDTRSLAGQWRGEIRLPGAPLAVELVFSRGEPGGTIAGLLSIPMEGAFDIPLGEVEQDGDEVSFRMADVPGEPSFHGWMGPDGRYLTGRFQQDSQEFDFRLERISPVPPESEDGADTVRSGETPDD